MTILLSKLRMDNDGVRCAVLECNYALLQTDMLEQMVWVVPAAEELESLAQHAHEVCLHWKQCVRKESEWMRQ